MTFEEVLELAKYGLGKPNFTYQSDHLLWLTLRNLLNGYRNQLIPRDEVLEQKEQAQKLLERSRLEEQQRLEVYRKHQKDMKLCGELLFELNHALKEEPQDREKLLRLMARLTDRWSGMTHYEELLFREG